MIKDLIRTISFGHVEDVKVLNEKITGHNINIKIEGFIRPVEIKNVLSREINKAKNKTELEGIVENDYIKVLRVEKWILNDYIIIYYKQKKSGGVFFEKAYADDKLVYYSLIIVDWFDEKGDPIISIEIKTKLNPRGNMFYNVTASSPSTAKSYQIRLAIKD